MLDPEEVIRFILNRKYFLKLYRVPKGTWRRRISEELIRIHGFEHTNVFVDAWEYLDKEGLLK